MEKNVELEKKLDNLISFVKNQKEYKNCLEIKEKMSNNKKLSQLIEEVKSLQKDYIRSNNNLDIKNKLDRKQDELDNIPLYVSYNNELELVNEMLLVIEDELNKYFNNKLNKG